MIRVGVTGGMGSGKSTVLAAFAKLGAATLSADDIAKEMIEPKGPAYRPVAARFPDVLKRDGHLDHSRLAAKVFTDARSLAWLDGLVHPLVARRLDDLMGGMEKTGVQVVAVEVPLLYEAGLASMFDVVIDVTAPEEVRVERLVAQGWSAAEVRRRIKLQADEESRLAIADIVIVNDALKSKLQRAVKRAWDRLTQTAATAAAGGGRRAGKVSEAG